MLVFEATTELQGTRDDDYHWAENGELVHLPVADCSSPACGCTRGFAGFTSLDASFLDKLQALRLQSDEPE